jgi:hypothetical protein
MKTFFIPTNSVDGTTDALLQIAAETGVSLFRWNIDLWQDYEICFDGEHFRFSDPLGRTVDVLGDDVFLLWRKPFTSLMNFDELSLESADREQARVQVGQCLQAVVALMRPLRRVRLVEPYADRRLPKLCQLRLAREFFAVPTSLFSVRDFSMPFGFSVVAKPLGDPSVGESRIFYTRPVDPDCLFRPFPWFLQQALIGGQDITCAYILGQSHFYVCDYKRDASAIDWRVEINTESPSVWQKCDHPDRLEWESAVNRYMFKVGLHFGRLDFILQGDVLYFLECNTNGQFGWLDDFETLGLHREFLAAACNPAAVVI